MNLPQPIPATWIALWLLVPGVLLFGRWLAGKATADRELATLTAPGCAVGALVAASHVLSYTLGSFHLGWLLAMIVLGGGGGAAWAHSRRAGGLELTFDLRAWAVPLGALVASLLVVVPLAFGWAFHDEVQLYSHLSTIAQLQNDVYPPRYPTFPEWELRYHYGFNVLAAALTGMARVPSDVAVDVVTVGGWSYAWIVLAALGRRAADHAAGWLAAPLGLLGGGYSALCTTLPADCPSCGRVAACGVGDELINGPFLSYLFQHPWGLGLPLAGTALLLASDRSQAHPARYAVLALVMFGLTFSQFAIYLAVGATLVFATVVEAPDNRVRRAGLLTGLLGLGFAIASQFGGFFAPTPGDGALIAWSPGITGGGVLAELRWFAATFGLLLPLGIAGVFVARAHRWMLAPLALGGLPLVLLLTWGGVKWDVFKFATLSQVFLGVASGVALARLWARGPDFAAGVAARAGVAVLALATVWGGLSFGVPFLQLSITGENDEPLEIRFARAHPTTSGADAEAMVWLREHMRPYELVMRTDFEASFAYQIWAGLSVPWTEHRAAMFGFNDARMRQREALFDVRPERFEALRDEGIVWFVVHPRDPRGLQLAMQQWTADGRAAVMAQFGELRVVRLRPRSR